MPAIDEFDNAALFPVCPTYGFVAIPRYRTEKIEAFSGIETRYSLWEYPLHDYRATVGPRREQQIALVRDFFHAMGGEWKAFRFRDYQDFVALEQPALPIGSSTTRFQLFRTYTAGSSTRLRVILTPRGSTVTVYANGTPVGSGYTLDETTGELEFDAPPATPVTWSGEFDVPVRFEGDFPLTISSYRVQEVSFLLREQRPLPPVVPSS